MFYTIILKILCRKNLFISAGQQRNTKKFQCMKVVHEEYFCPKLFNRIVALSSFISNLLFFHLFLVLKTVVFNTSRTTMTTFY